MVGANEGPPEKSPPCAPTSKVQERSISESLRVIEGIGVEALMYGNITGRDGRIGLQVVEEFLAPLQPRDPLERMLLLQALWCHLRAHLMLLRQPLQTTMGSVVLMDDQSDKAMASFRKCMLTLKEYRSEGKGSPLVAVQQINRVSGGNRRMRQIVTQPINERTIATNKLGANHGDPETNYSQSSEPIEVDGLHGGRA